MHYKNGSGHLPFFFRSISEPCLCWSQFTSLPREITAMESHCAPLKSSYSFHASFQISCCKDCSSMSSQQRSWANWNDLAAGIAFILFDVCDFILFGKITFSATQKPILSTLLLLYYVCTTSKPCYQQKTKYTGTNQLAAGNICITAYEYKFAPLFHSTFNQIHPARCVSISKHSRRNALGNIYVIINATLPWASPSAVARTPACPIHLPLLPCEPGVCEFHLFVCTCAATQQHSTAQTTMRNK